MISTLSALIAAAESSNNPYAIRYEPAHAPASNFVTLMMQSARCNLTTAEVLCKCSWGLYQIMGDELMARGLRISPLDFCNDVSMQHMMFGDVLIEKGLNNNTLNDILNNSNVRANFAAKYNGPDEIAEYSQYLLDTYNRSK
jgi:hypothetical protein